MKYFSYKVNQWDQISKFLEVHLINAIFSLLAPACMGTLITYSFEQVNLISSPKSSSWFIRLAYGFGFLGLSTLISLFFKQNFIDYSTLWEVTEAVGGGILGLFATLCSLYLFSYMYLHKFGSLFNFHFS